MPWKPDPFLELAISLLLLGLTIWVFWISNQPSSVIPRNLQAVTKYSNKRLLIGLWCSNNSLIYNKIFISMMGLELSRLGYDPNSILIFCFRSKSKEYNLPVISSIYQLRFLNKTTLLVKIVTNSNLSLVNLSSCEISLEELGNIKIIRIYLPRNMSIEQQKYCIAQGVYNLTLAYLAPRKI